MQSAWWPGRTAFNTQQGKSPIDTELSNKLANTQKAYLNITGLTADMAAGEVEMMLGNLGTIPANKIRMQANLYLVTPGIEKIKGEVISWDAGDAALFPACFTMRVVLPMTLGPEEVKAILAKKEILYVAGKVQYEAGFGRIDSTNFAFEYSPPPNKRWTVNSGFSKFDGPNSFIEPRHLETFN
jgi:hypothetical protein